MKTAFSKIVEQEKRNDSIKVLEFTNKVPEFMSVSDLVVTKPGGLTTSESLASKLPMVIINPIPGQEEENAQFLEENGIAIWIKKYDNPYEKLQNLFSDTKLLPTMKENTEKLSKKYSTQNICKILFN